MPDFYVKLKLSNTDSTAVSGEDLDREVEEALEMLDVDGYEVTKAEVSRDNPATIAKGKAKEDQRTLDQAILCAIRCERGGGKEPSHENPEFTNEQMLSWSVMLMWRQHSQLAEHPEIGEAVAKIMREKVVV